MSHFTNNDVLSERQHGFRARRSCESQLISLTQELHEHLEKKSQIDLIMLDFSKAFEKVPHQRLMGKIWNQRIQGTTHRWINGFLSDRLQRVIVDGEASDWSVVESGVPQGTVLGPILFLSFINDLPLAVPGCLYTTHRALCSVLSYSSHSSMICHWQCQVVCILLTGHCARSYLIPLIHQWSVIGSARLSVYYSQGTVLGPILFLSFINDLPLAVPGCLYTTHRALCSVLSYSSHSSMICHWQCQVVCILLTGHCARSYLIPLIHQWSAIGSARLSVYYSQGTVLGPILFLSFINDLSLAVPGCLYTTHRALCSVLSYSSHSSMICHWQCQVVCILLTGHCARSYLIPLIHQWSVIGSARLSVYYSQSTVLGPILFLSFINDLPLAVPGCLYTTHRALCSVLSYSSHSSMICHWQCQVVCILLTGHCARSYLIPLIHQWSAIGSARLSVYYSQSTVLGPILFLSFINDLPLAVPGCLYTTHRALCSVLSYSSHSSMICHWQCQVVCILLTGHCARSYLIPLIHQWSAIGSARLSVYYSQGTVLGPILFLSFINDLPLAVPGCLYTTHRALCSVLSYSSHSSMICHWQCQVVCILLTGHCARAYLIPLIHQWSAIGSARLSVYYSQGTVLSPILFLSFINDLPLAVPGCLYTTHRALCSVLSYSSHSSMICHWQCQVVCILLTGHCAQSYLIPLIHQWSAIGSARLSVYYSQSTVLGPILFLSFINDLPLTVPGCGVRLFADDCVLYHPISSQADCEALQTDLSNLEAWERKWCMYFNLDKCNIMTVTKKRNKIIHKYKLHEHELERVNSTTYLGVELSGNLTWNRHIAKTCNKATKTLSFLRRNLRVRNVQAKSLAYKGLVRPTLEY